MITSMDVRTCGCIFCSGMPRSKTSSEVFSNSSLEEMSSSDPDEDVPSSQGYRVSIYI